jgi:hypothetical protein
MDVLLLLEVRDAVREEPLAIEARCRGSVRPRGVRFAGRTELRTPQATATSPPSSSRSNATTTNAVTPMPLAARPRRPLSSRRCNDHPGTAAENPRCAGHPPSGYAFAVVTIRRTILFEIGSMRTMLLEHPSAIQTAPAPLATWPQPISTGSSRLRGSVCPPAVVHAPRPALRLRGRSAPWREGEHCIESRTATATQVVADDPARDEERCDERDRRSTVAQVGSPCIRPVEVGEHGSGVPAAARCVSA